MPDHATQSDRPSAALRQRTARGTVVNAAFLVALYTLSMSRGFFVAATITTEEYGVWGIVYLTFTTLLWLKQVGVADKYVQQDEDDQELAFQRAFTVELAITGAFATVLLAAAPIVALVYGREELLLPGLAIVPTLVAWLLQSPLWVFYRRMDFVRQRTLQSVEPVLGFVVTVALAVAGAGYWSLIVGMLVGAWGAALAALWASPFRLAIRFDRKILREYASFSWPLFAAAASSLVIAQSSLIVGEHAVGLAGVGVIALAYSLSTYVNRVDEVITQTLYPAICAARDRTEVLFESFVKSNRLALMWGLPFGVGVALFAADLVDLLGEQWESGVTLIQAFGLVAGIAHIGFNWDAFYRARGETRPIAVWSLVCMATFMATGVPLLLAEGLDGLALGVAIMAAVSLAVRLLYLRRIFPGFGVARHMARAIAPTLPAVAATLALRALAHEETAAMALGELALYVGVTAAATALLERDLLREVAGYLRPASIA